MDNFQINNNKKRSLFFFLALLGTTLFVYSDVLFGDKVFLSSNYAMDLYEQFFPKLLSMARQVSKGEFFDHIDFSNGLGYKTSIYPYLIMYLPAFFGVKNVAYMLSVIQVIKLVLAGFFFYLYLRKICNDDYAAMIGGLGYAFCGPMIVRQFWGFYSAEDAD